LRQFEAGTNDGSFTALSGRECGGADLLGYRARRLSRLGLPRTARSPSEAGRKWEHRLVWGPVGVVGGCVELGRAREGGASEAAKTLIRCCAKRTSATSAGRSLAKGAMSGEPGLCCRVRRFRLEGRRDRALGSP